MIRSFPTSLKHYDLAILEWDTLSLSMIADDLLWMGDSVTT